MYFARHCDCDCYCKSECSTSGIWDCGWDHWKGKNKKKKKKKISAQLIYTIPLFCHNSIPHLQKITPTVREWKDIIKRRFAGEHISIRSLSHQVFYVKWTAESPFDNLVFKAQQEENGMVRTLIKHRQAPYNCNQLDLTTGSAKGIMDSLMIVCY